MLVITVQDVGGAVLDMLAGLLSDYATSKSLPFVRPRQPARSTTATTSPATTFPVRVMDGGAGLAV